MFLKSIADQDSFVDFVLVGDSPPPFLLPHNTQHFHITWDALADRVADVVFQDPKADITGFRGSGFYKVCNLKPLTGRLFPELIGKGTDWWGFCDADIILGDMSIIKKKLPHFDIISPMNSLAWGPFMLYRNTPSVNQLSTLGSEHLKLMLNFPKILSFSEWGPRSKHSAAQAGISANFSITTLLADHCENKVRRTDSPCVGRLRDRGRCYEHMLSLHSSNESRFSFQTPSPIQRRWEISKRSFMPL